MTTKWELEAFNRLFDRTVILDNGCFEFTGGKDKNGYGKFTVLGITHRAHRIAFMLCVDDIPDGASVLHSCDNPSCINPNHLFLGTHQNNVDDMMAKRRNIPPRGSMQGQSKLTEDDVREIRKLLDQGLSYRDIAARYNVTNGNIYLIKHNRRWSHLEG